MEIYIITVSVHGAQRTLTTEDIKDKYTEEQLVHHYGENWREKYEDGDIENEYEDWDEVDALIGMIQTDSQEELQAYLEQAAKDYRIPISEFIVNTYLVTKSVTL